MLTERDYPPGRVGRSTDRNSSTGRRLVAAGAAVALAATMAACSSSGGGGSGSSTSDKKDLLMWEPATESEAFKPIVAAFEKQSGIKVKTLVLPSDGFENALLTKWAAGNRPDLMLWHAIGNWLVAINPTQNLQDLSAMSFVKKTPASVIDNSVRYQGKVWAALLDTPQVDLVSYNKQVFSKLGLNVPTNFAELLSLCKTIKSKDSSIAPITMGSGDTWPTQIPAFMMFNTALKSDPDIIQRINTNKAHFTDQEFLIGFTATQKLQQEGCFNSNTLSETYAQSVDDLMKGKAAMEFAVGPAATLPTYTVKELNSTEGVFPLSYTNNVASWQEAGTGIYAPKTGDSTREAEARQFLDFVTGPYYQTYLNTTKQEPLLTGFKAPAGIPTPYVDAYKILKSNSVPQYQQDLQANYSNEFANWIVAMLGGKMTPQQVAQKMQDSFALNAQQVGLPGF